MHEHLIYLHVHMSSEYTLHHFDHPDFNQKIFKILFGFYNNLSQTLFHFPKILFL